MVFAVYIPKRLLPLEVFFGCLARADGSVVSAFGSATCKVKQTIFIIRTTDRKREKTLLIQAQAVYPYKS